MPHEHECPLCRKTFYTEIPAILGYEYTCPWCASTITFDGTDMKMFSGNIEDRATTASVDVFISRLEKLVGVQ